MENKIQELTDKIYREGVEKGKEEAQALVTAAKEEAQRIILAAQEEAQNLKSEAAKKSAELTENTQTELKLFARQAVNALKVEIANLLTQETISQAVKGFVSNQEDLNRFIVGMASHWSQEDGLVISTSQAEDLKKHFLTQAKELLDKGVKIEQVNGNKALFSITPSDGSYKINFGEEEFENYFKDFLRPQLVEKLF